MKNIIIILFIYIATIQLSFSQNSDNKNPILTDKFLVSAGIYSPFKQVKFGADGTLPSGVIDDIDFDESFGLDGIQNTFTFNFIWRFSKNWSVSTDYFRIGSENKAILNEDIEWNGYTFQKGSQVKAGFGISLYKIFFGRVISRGNKHEFGGGLGIHAFNVDGFIEGNALIDDVSVGFEKSEVSVILPLPNIGFWYYYAPTKKWAFTAKMDWFGIKIGDISGVLWNINPGINYQIFENLGVSLNYKYISIAADVDKDTWNGDFNLGFQGPSFTITGNF